MGTTAQFEHENTALDGNLGDVTDLPKTYIAHGKVSIVTVSYWTGPLLTRSVFSALQQPEVHEVIIVDNGNWESELTRLNELLGADMSRVRIIQGQGNIGYAAGCNCGARVAKGEYIFLLNPDAILPNNAIAEMLEESRKFDDTMWVMGGKLLNPDGTEQAGSRRQPLTPWSAFVEMTKLYRVAPKHPYFKRFNAHQDPCPSGTTEMPVISGACMLMPTQAYRAIGGMNEDYFLHVEDVDFCLRLRAAGGKVYFAPKTSIIHHKSSSRSNPLRVEISKAKSMVHYFWSHFSDTYPKSFLRFMSVFVWIGVALRAVKFSWLRLISTFGLARSGRAALRKARHLSNSRQNR